jgi:hypothetical protein
MPDNIDDILETGKAKSPTFDSQKNNFVFSKNRKDPSITFLWNFFFPGSGYLYLGGPYLTTGIILLLVQFILGFLTAVTGGAFFIWGIPVWITVMITGFSSTNKYNALIDAETKKEKETFDKVQKEQEIIRKEKDDKDKKVKCTEFISKLEKYHKLMKNDLLSNEEYNNKKQKLISEVRLYKVAEQAEDFLIEMIDLKNKGLISQEDLTKIKEALII